LLGGQGNVQRSDIFLELFDFSASDDGKHIGELVQVVRNSDYKCASTCNLER
jgi:hypothetical protein